MQIAYVRVLQGTECFCGAAKPPVSALCRRCYFELRDDLRDRMFPVMAAGLLVRARYEFPQTPMEFWYAYPYLVGQCLTYLREHTNRFVKEIMING